MNYRDTSKGIKVTINYSNSVALQCMEMETVNRHNYASSNRNPIETKNKMRCEMFIRNLNLSRKIIVL